MNNIGYQFTTGNTCAWRISNSSTESGSQSFGGSSKFGLKNPFQLFNLPQTVSVSPPTRLGIRSVAATLPQLTKNFRYLSSACWQLSLKSIRLIIGQCVCKMILGNLSVAKVETIIEPDCITDDVGWKPVTFVCIHPPILSNETSLFVSTDRRLA
jgi:hypothetical protein